MFSETTAIHGPTNVVPADRKPKHIKMKNPWLLTCTLCLLTAIEIHASTEFENLDKLVDEIMTVELDKRQVRGGAISIVIDGRLVLSRGYGFGDAAGANPVSADHTIFRIASVSKLFIATSVMQLVELGHLDLDADANEYLAGSGLQIPNTFGKAVTLRHLLSHSAGFEEAKNGFYSDKKDYPLTLTEFLIRFQPKQVREPGLLSSYCNWSSTTAALIVERVSGMPFEEYVLANIFLPLGMSQSTFEEPPPTRLAAKLANGVQIRNGEYIDRKFDYILSPAGSMSSTAADISKYMIAVLDADNEKHNRILDATSFDELLTPGIHPHPEYPGVAVGFIEREINNYRLFGHNGVVAAFRSLLTLDRTNRIGIFTVFNGNNGAAIADRIVESFYDQYFPSTAMADQAVSPGDYLDEFVGNYRPARLNVSTFSKVSALFSPEIQVRRSETSDLVVTSRLGAFHYVSTGGDVFRRAGGAERVAFTRSEKGDIAYFLDYNQATKPAIKLTWWEEAELHRAVLLISFVVFAIAIFYKTYKLNKNFASNKPVLITDRFIAATLLVLLVFCVGMFLSIDADGDAFGTGWSMQVLILLTLPVIGGLLTVFSGACVLADWLDNSLTLSAKIIHTMLVLCAITFLAVLYYWNALVWQV